MRNSEYMYLLSTEILTPLSQVCIEYILKSKVIREKSRGEGSLIVQDTIENVSEPKFFF